MSLGPHVFGDGRLHCWMIHSQNFTDKLRHRVPLLVDFGVTDFDLPPQATLEDKQIVKAAGGYVALYEPPPHGLAGNEYAAKAVADVNRLAVGALELNVEGLADHELADFMAHVIELVRAKKPNLRLRINVVPFKGSYLPAQLFVDDPQLYLVVQNYLGNMQERVSEWEIVADVLDAGIDEEKVAVMYGAHIGNMGKPRVRALPQMRRRASIYSDDLLTDAGYI